MGGAALVLRGFIDRVTVDVDVIAQLHADNAVMSPDPFDAALADAVARVAAGYGYDADWMNGHVSRFWRRQWPVGLPDGLLADIEWRTYGGLRVGLAGRTTLIAMKLRALATQAVYQVGADLRTVAARIPPDPDVRRHLDDLMALGPSEADLDAARTWVMTNADGPDFPFAFAAACDAVRHAR